MQGILIWDIFSFKSILHSRLCHTRNNIINSFEKKCELFWKKSLKFFEKIEIFKIFFEKTVLDGNLARFLA